MSTRQAHCQWAPPTSDPTSQHPSASTPVLTPDKYPRIGGGGARHRPPSEGSTLRPPAHAPNHHHSTTHLRKSQTTHVHCPSPASKTQPRSQSQTGIDDGEQRRSRGAHATARREPDRAAMPLGDPAHAHEVRTRAPPLQPRGLGQGFRPPSARIPPAPPQFVHGSRLHVSLLLPIRAFCAAGVSKLPNWR
jgi:hypothetical protein